MIDSVNNDKVASWYQDKRSIILAIQRQPGTNTVEVAQAITDLLPELRREIPPAVNMEVANDASQPIRRSINDVKFTLVLTVCLVVMVIFLFLRNISATLIPGVAVPLSIVGTFAAMYLLGYSLNNLSLMALTLSVGFVVDDAIVMLENIVRYMEMGHPRMEAALLASREIGFTIISMTISLVSVFIPVLFMGGIVGRLLHEFSVTIAVAILISGFVSLSLTPMLGSRFLRVSAEAKHGAVYRVLENGFNGLTHLYDYTPAHGSALSIRHAAGRLRPAGRNAVSVLHHAHRIHSQPGQRIHVRRHHGRAGHFIRFHGPEARVRSPISRSRIPAVSDVGAFVMGGNQGFFFVNLKPRDRAHALRGSDHRENASASCSMVPGIMAFLQNPPPITVSGQFSTSVYK